MNGSLIGYFIGEHSSICCLYGWKISNKSQFQCHTSYLWDVCSIRKIFCKSIQWDILPVWSDGFVLGSSGKWYSSHDARMDSECIGTFRTEVMITGEKDSALGWYCRTVKAADPTFDRFKCPLFYKFTISLSGFAERDRNTIKQYVEREGATYSPNLIKDSCTHLICKEPKGNFYSWKKTNTRFRLGSKYEHAIKWRIPVLKPEWIFDSSEKGSCLRLTNFLWPTLSFDANSSNSKGYLLIDALLSFIEFFSLENEKPLGKETVESSIRIIPIDLPRKSTSLFTTEYMIDLEERFEKWINNRSKKIVDDLFDGLKV